MIEGTVIGASAYLRNGLPELRVDVSIEDGETVPVYHSPRETNKDVTKDFLAGFGLAKDSFGKEFDGKSVKLRAETDPEYGVRYALSSYRADEAVIDSLFPDAD